jgi:hypothetical protein
MQLVDAQTVCVDKQRGFLTLRLKFGNSYKKAIESVVFSYSFRDSVGNVRFSERARISKAVGGKFKGVCTFLIPENYNAVAAFMFADVPVQAPESMQIALGKKRANRKVERDFLLRGLRVSPLKVIFADGSSVVPKAN